MGLFGKKKKEEKPSFGNVGSGQSTGRKPDFSNVSSGGSSTAAPAPPRQAPAAPAERRHRVAAGESLSKIAQQHYGDAGQWRRIYEANRQTIGENPDLIHPGQDLVIPQESAR